MNLPFDSLWAMFMPSRRAYGVLEVDGDYLGMDPTRPIAPPMLVGGLRHDPA